MIGVVAVPGQVTYVATKFAVGLSTAMADEYEPLDSLDDGSHDRG